MAAKKEPQDGDRYKVKATPSNRRYGVDCSSDVKDNCKVWPGDIGEIVTFQGNGWRGMMLEFPHGRRVHIGTLYSDSDAWEIDADRMQDFKKIR